MCANKNFSSKHFLLLLNWRKKLSLLASRIPGNGQRQRSLRQNERFSSFCFRLSDESNVVGHVDDDVEVRRLHRRLRLRRLGSHVSKSAATFNKYFSINFSSSIATLNLISNELDLNCFIFVGTHYGNSQITKTR